MSRCQAGLGKGERLQMTIAVCGVGGRQIRLEEKKKLGYGDPGKSHQEVGVTELGSGEP